MKPGIYNILIGDGPVAEVPVPVFYRTECSGESAPSEWRCEFSWLGTTFVFGYASEGLLVLRRPHMVAFAVSKTARDIAGAAFRAAQNGAT